MAILKYQILATFRVPPIIAFSPHLMRSSSSRKENPLLNRASERTRERESNVCVLPAAMTKDTFDSPRRSSYGGTSAVVKSSSISRSRSNRFVAHNDGGDDKWDGNQEDFLPPHSLGRHSGNGKSVMVEILQSAKRDEDEMDDAKLDEEEERGIMASMSADDDLSLPEKDEEEEPQQQQQDLPTALEALLDLELDVHNLPALEDNQFALQEQCDAFGEMSGLSLELLVVPQ